MYKIKVHSVVELITNSSTEIYTFSEGCIGPVKEVINEMLSLMNSTETFDDIFYVDVFLEDLENYYDYGENELFPDDNNLDGLEPYKYIEKVVNAVLKKEISRPEWMSYIDERSTRDSNYYRSTSLYLLAKEEIYQPLADKLINFLYSPYNEESYN